MISAGAAGTTAIAAFFRFTFDFTSTGEKTISIAAKPFVLSFSHFLSGFGVGVPSLG